jgi:hypothetical protein
MSRDNMKTENTKGSQRWQHLKIRTNIYQIVNVVCWSGDSTFLHY